VSSLDYPAQHEVNPADWCAICGSDEDEHGGDWPDLTRPDGELERARRLTIQRLALEMADAETEEAFEAARDRLKLEIQAIEFIESEAQSSVEARPQSAPGPDGPWMDLDALDKFTGGMIFPVVEAGLDAKTYWEQAKARGRDAFKEMLDND